MTTPVIIDFTVAAVLLGFAAYGLKRGLFRALAGLVAVIIALVGAGLVAASFSGPAAKLVTPLAAQYIEEKVADAMAEQASRVGQIELPEHAEESVDADIRDLLSIIGFDEDIRGELATHVEETVHATGATVTAAVVESLAYSFIYGALYILSFLLILLLMKVLIGAMDLVLKLPGLRALNALGGALIGLIEGALLLFLAVWALRRLGVSFESEALADAHILRIFTANTPLGVLMSLFQ